LQFHCQNSSAFSANLCQTCQIYHVFGSFTEFPHYALIGSKFWNSRDFKHFWCILLMAWNRNKCSFRKLFKELGSVTSLRTATNQHQLLRVQPINRNTRQFSLQFFFPFRASSSLWNNVYFCGKKLSISLDFEKKKPIARD